MHSVHYITFPFNILFIIEGISEEYEGEWVEGINCGAQLTHKGCMHGWGRYVFSDGAVYEGQWIAGKVS